MNFPTTFNTMKICAAQTKAFKGDISKNIDNHKGFIHLAVEKKTDLIIFSELSLTGTGGYFYAKAAFVKTLSTNSPLKPNEF
jgi:predicted amidohydrolase